MENNLVKIGSLGNEIQVLNKQNVYRIISKSGLCIDIKKEFSFNLQVYNNYLFFYNNGMKNRLVLRKCIFLKNIIKGLLSGYLFHLSVIGVGYRFIRINDNEFNIKVGYSNLIKIKLPETVSVLFLKNTEILLRSFDYTLLKETCLKIKQIRVPDCYKGKGIRYSNEIIRLKNIKKNT